MSYSERPKTVIGWRTATVLYALLIVAAVVTLTGKMLALGLIIVGGVAVKSYLGYWRERG